MADPQLDRIETKLTAVEGKCNRLAGTVWGNPEEGRKSLEDRIMERLNEISGDLRGIRTDVDEMKTEKLEADAERRGMKRAIGYTGVTNVLNLVALVAGLYSLWSVFG